MAVHIAELSLDLAQAIKDLDTLEKLVRERSITLGQIAKVDFSISGLFEQQGQPVPRLFSDIAKEATLMEKRIGASVQAAKKKLEGMHPGGDIIDYFKQNGQKTAVEWTQAFEQEFRGTDFKKLMSPYIKWSQDGVHPDFLTGELSEKFPQLGKDVFNYVELWERLAQQVRNYRSEVKRLAETGVDAYFGEAEITARGASDAFDRIIEQQERLYSAGGFTDRIGKGLMSAEDIQEMAAWLEVVSDIQTKIAVTTDDSGKAVRVNIDYVGELNEKLQETYKWVSETDEETGAVTEGFKRIDSVATKSADAAKKLLDEFNRTELAVKNMNLASIRIFEQGGDTEQLGKLYKINAQMKEIRESTFEISRLDVERAKELQYQSQLIAVAAKEEKLRQQAVKKEAAEIAAQYSDVAAIQKDITKYRLDTSGYSAQLAVIKEQSAALFEKLSTSRLITDEEREQLKVNRQLLTQIGAQVSAQQSEKAGVLSPERSGGLLEQSGKWFGAYQAWHLLKKMIVETAEAVRETETAMMEISRVMEMTKEQSDRLRDSLFGVASGMAQSFEDTVEISKKFAQAGFKDTAENIELTRVALLAMNTAELDAVNSTDSMIGILKQWKLEASDLNDVVDKLNYTADNNAITTQDLVDGLLRASGAAKNAGISFNETVGALVTLREATGRSGKEIGTALNSLISFTRRPGSRDVFESMGVTVYLDEAKTAMVPLIEQWRQLSELVNSGGSDVVKRLSEMPGAIDLVTREIAETIGMQEEYNQLFDEALTDMERMQVYNQASTFRQNFWIALLENFEKINEVVSDMPNALGHSARENARYMETLDAKLKQLGTVLRELAVQAGEAGLIDLAKAAADAATATAKLTKNAGGAIPVLVQIGIVAAALRKEAKLLNTDLNISSIINMLKKSGAEMAAAYTAAQSSIAGAGAAAKVAAGNIAGLLGPVGLAIVAFQALTLAVNAYSQSLERQWEADIEAGRAAYARADALDAVIKKHAELMALGINSDNEQFLSLENEIIGALNGHVEKLRDVAIGTREYAAALSEAAQEQRKFLIADLESAYKAAFSKIQRSPGKIVPIHYTVDETLAMTRYFDLLQKRADSAGGVNEKVWKAADKEINLVKADMDDLIEKYVQWQVVMADIQSPEGFTAFKESLIALVGGSEAASAAITVLLKDLLPEFTGAMNSAAVATNENAAKTEFYKNKIEELSAAVGDINSSVEALKAAAEEYNKTGVVSVDTFKKIIENSGRYLEFLIDENGQLVLNEEALNNVAKAEIEALAVKQALALVDSVKKYGAESAALSLLADSTVKASDAMWGLVYANIAALDEGDEIREMLIARAEQMRTLAEAAKSNIGLYGAGGLVASAIDAEAEARRGQADAVRDEISALQKREELIREFHNNEIKRLNDEARAAQESFKKREDAVKSLYDAEIASLRALKSEYSREDARADYEKRREELLVERADMEKRTGREAAERIKEIDKQLAELDENERRRQRDIAIDVQIENAEKERDRKIAAIKREAAAEQERYDKQIAAIEQVMEQERLYFEEQVNNFNEILELIEKGEQTEAYKKAYAAQKKELESLKNKTGDDTKTMGLFIEQMYLKATQDSSSFANSAVVDANRVVEAYQRMINKMNEAIAKSQQAARASSPGGSLSVPSSHTGSLVLSEGLVNVAPGEIIMRPDISAGLLKIIDQMDSGAANSYDNRSYGGPSYGGNTYNIDVHLDGAVFETKSAAKTFVYDLNREITKVLGQNAF